MFWLPVVLWVIGFITLVFNKKIGFIIIVVSVVLTLATVLI